MSDDRIKEWLDRTQAIAEKATRRAREPRSAKTTEHGTMDLMAGSNGRRDLRAQDRIEQVLSR